MISKVTLKRIVKISLWTYIVLTCCPQIVDLIKTLFSESFKWGVDKTISAIINHLTTVGIPVDTINDIAKYLIEHNTFNPDRGY